MLITYSISSSITVTMLTIFFYAFSHQLLSPWRSLWSFSSKQQRIPRRALSAPATPSEWSTGWKRRSSASGGVVRGHRLEEVLQILMCAIHWEKSTGKCGFLARGDLPWWKIHHWLLRNRLENANIRGVANSFGKWTSDMCWWSLTGTNQSYEDLQEGLPNIYFDSIGSSNSFMNGQIVLSNIW